MAVNTILLDLTVDPQKILEKNGLKSAVQDVLSKFIPELKEVYTSDFQGGGTLYTFTAVRDSFITVRAFTKGVISINIEYYRENGDEPFLSFETIRQLEENLTKQTKSTRSHKYPALTRGGNIDRYFLTADERLIEYDIDAVVFEEQSPYQKVQIFHTKSFGNMLVLDENQNMSERDLIYTETLMQRGKEDYAGKEIVILGGGDGALLYELLKEKPKFVTMLELDEVVIRACREHMRGCCGDILDQLEGSNYKVVIDDCIKSLDKMITEGKQVDYVFGDLTEIPVSTCAQGELWDFLRLILNKAFQVLRPSGKFMSHGDAACRPASLALYENELRNLPCSVEFAKDKAFIPSFLEDWVFYQVWLRKRE
ncbi:spermine synthase-like [Macrosteles quadrilineatus]|uniref:spermine synthase-like n=1 Tax=Macrosteles quadrilineatus TaxID=74068 RepID=UPI0023E0E9B1|nr:spermine synthase-like [Macrosteles quadrilineatus]XP_054261024.1 spermine synthase-like [Macrosteles quadrilineatus]XP_054261025.1 spermine synthase-like [Macrosteles quadrilineatus]